jgi:hypothetical protein
MNKQPVIYDEDDWSYYLDEVNQVLRDYFPCSPLISKARMIPRLTEVSEGKDSRDVADAVTRWLRSADTRKQVRSIPAVLYSILPKLVSGQ